MGDMELSKACFMVILKTSGNRPSPFSFYRTCTLMTRKVNLRELNNLYSFNCFVGFNTIFQQSKKTLSISEKPDVFNLCHF